MSMANKRKRYSTEFKAAAVAACAPPGRAASQVASELGVAPSMLSRWHNGKRPAPCVTTRPSSASTIAASKSAHERTLLRTLLARAPLGECARYLLVFGLQDEFPVSNLCHALNVSRSGFYAWRSRTLQPHATPAEGSGVGCTGTSEAAVASRKITGNGNDTCGAPGAPGGAQARSATEEC